MCNYYKHCVSYSKSVFLCIAHVMNIMYVCFILYPEVPLSHPHVFEHAGPELYNLRPACAPFSFTQLFLNPTTGLTLSRVGTSLVELWWQPSPEPVK